MARTTSARWLLMSACITLIALVGWAAAAQACSNPGFATNSISGADDFDQDGFNDTGEAELVYPGQYYAAASVHVNITLEYQNGTPIGSNSSGPYVYLAQLDQTFVFAHVTLSPDLPAGNVTLRATMDEGSGPCDWQNLSFDLYPTGEYMPQLPSGLSSAQVDQDSSATYAVNVTNAGNLPDHIGLTVSSSAGWEVSVVPDNVSVDPGATVEVNLTVRAPHNAAPFSADNTTITASSLRKASPNATLTVETTVKAQVFVPQLSSQAPTLSVTPGGTIHFEVQVDNAGNNHDTIMVFAPAAAAGWSITLSATSFSLDAGWSDTFSVNVTTPLSLTGLVAWSPTITASSNNGSATATLVLTAKLSLADFEVAPADVSVSVAHPVAGASVSVVVTVHNIALQSGEAIIVSLNDGTTNQTATVTVGASGTVVATFTWVALSGTSTLVATADASHSVPEEDEDNNAATVTVVADAPPVAHASSATASGEPGKAVSISAASSTDADGNISGYYFDFGDGSNSDWVTNATVSHTYAAAGTYTVNMKVRDNAGAESGNATSIVTIAAPKGSTPGFEAPLGVAALGLLALASIVTRRRRGT